jgi:Domain of unknown function (DUF4136)
MKKIMCLCLMSVAFICASNAQTISVHSDRALNTDFSKYKTFYWSSQADAWLDEGGIYFLNDLGMKAMIRDAVKSELMGLGYQIDSYEPDMIVNFRVFDKPVTLKGFEGYGSSYWSGQPYRSISDTTSYNVEAGTLLVSLADRKSGQVVWQGFASGLIENNAFVKEEGRIREAVNMIFDEYNQRAKEYTRK